MRPKTLTFEGCRTIEGAEARARIWFEQWALENVATFPEDWRDEALESYALAVEAAVQDVRRVLRGIKEGLS
jgi:hypothetical protein